MAENKNITMKQYNGLDYDTLYPKTKVRQVEGGVASVNGAMPNDSGEVKVNSFDSGIELGMAEATNGGYVDFHYAGNTSNFTSRIIEEQSGQLLFDCIPSFTNPIPLESGGTGTQTLEGLIHTVFGERYDDWQSVSTYPTSPGIYRTVGTDIFKNLSFPHGNYGVLVIFKAEYALHIYLDEYNRMFYGRSSSAFAEPGWRKVESLIEEGSSGIWSYKQYRDGIAECWGSLSVSGNPSEQWGGLYALPVTVPNYPITFTAWPNIQYSFICDTDTSAGAWAVSYSGAGASMANPGQIAIVRPTNLAVSGTLKIYVRGTVS